MAVKRLSGIFPNDLRAIILDMDGVLVDSEPVHAESFRIFFKHHHIPYTEIFLDSLVGYSTDDNIKTINRFYTSEKPIDIGEGIKEKNRIYLDLINNLQLEPLDGIDALIALCGKNGIKMALASSSSREQVETILKNLSQNSKNKIDYREVFEVRVCGDEVTDRKPAPDIYEQVIKKLNIEVSECMAIEDSEAGIRSTKANGIYCVALKNQYLKHDKMADADFVISSITEFVQLLEA